MNNWNHTSLATPEEKRKLIFIDSAGNEVTGGWKQKGFGSYPMAPMSITSL